MRKFAGILSIVALAAALTACGSKNGNKTAAATDNMAADNVNMADANLSAPEPPAAAVPLTGQEFADAAAASDTFEIDSSRLALEKSQSADVKKFAQAMIEAHTASTAKLKAAGTKALPAIRPATLLPDDLQTRLDALKPQSGTTFDQAYMADQIAGHEATLSALQDYAASGEVPSLKSFAAEMVPIVTSHLERARAVKL